MSHNFIVRKDFKSFLSLFILFFSLQSYFVYILFYLYLFFPVFLYGAENGHIYLSKDSLCLSKKPDGSYYCTVDIYNDSKEAFSCVLRSSCSCVKISPSGHFSLKPGKNSVDISLNPSKNVINSTKLWIYFDILPLHDTIKANIIFPDIQTQGWQYDYPKTLFIGKSISFSDFLPYKLEFLYFSDTIKDYDFIPYYDDNYLSLSYYVNKFKNHAQIIMYLSPTIKWTNGRNVSKLFVKAINKKNKVQNISDTICIIGEISCVFDTSKVVFGETDDILLPLPRNRVIDVFCPSDINIRFSLDSMDSYCKVVGNSFINPPAIIVKYLYNDEVKYIYLKSSSLGFVTLFKHLTRDMYEFYSFYKIRSIRSLNLSLNITLLSSNLFSINGEGCFEVIFEKDNCSVIRHYHFCDNHFSLLK